MEYKIYKFRVYDKDNNFIETKSIESVDYNLAIKRLRRIYPYMTKFRIEFHKTHKPLDQGWLTVFKAINKDMGN